MQCNSSSSSSKRNRKICQWPEITHPLENSPIINTREITSLLKHHLIPESTRYMLMCAGKKFYLHTSAVLAQFLATTRKTSRLKHEDIQLWGFLRHVASALLSGLKWTGFRCKKVVSHTSVHQSKLSNIWMGMWWQLFVCLCCQATVNQICSKPHTHTVLKE